MPIQSMETENFTFIKYLRKEFGEIQKFKAVTSEVFSQLRKMKDVILDLSQLTTITSAEIGVVIHLARELVKKEKTVHIIPSQNVRSTLHSLNFEKMPGITLYKNLEDFQKQMSTT